MQLIKTFFAVALAAAPVYSAPAPITEATVSTGRLQTRDTLVFCKPKENESSIKSFKISVDNAKKQMKAAGAKEGKSGYPHRFENLDGIHWNVENCDSKKHPVLEYPVYWEGSKVKVWKYNEKAGTQDKTPIRVVYANYKGDLIYCGIMTHSDVKKDFKGDNFFEKCS